MIKVSQIKVSKHQTGIIGLDDVLKEISWETELNKQQQL